MAGEPASTVIQRVNALLRLAANNPNEEEARSAAVHAARLIAKHSLIVTDAEWALPPSSSRDISEPPTGTSRMRRHEKINYAIAAIIIAFMLWRSFFP